MLKGRAIVISSVSGGGKTSLINRLVELQPELFVAVTATSRAPRADESHGVHYYFFDEANFRERIQGGEFLEHAYVHGNHYGVPAGPVVERLEQGTSVILNIDVQGMRTVRERLGSEAIVSIFLLPPDDAAWEARLRRRGTDSEEVIRHRLEQGRSELAAADEYEYRVTNDDLERATDEVRDILRKEKIISTGG